MSPSLLKNLIARAKELNMYSEAYAESTLYAEFRGADVSISDVKAAMNLVNEVVTPEGIDLLLKAENVKIPY